MSSQSGGDTGAETSDCCPEGGTQAIEGKPRAVQDWGAMGEPLLAGDRAVGSSPRRAHGADIQQLGK